MKLFKRLLILALPLLLLSNEVIASGKHMSSYVEKKKEEKKRDSMKFKKKDPTKQEQALEDLKLLSTEMHKYYKVEDYPAGSENESTYTSLKDLLTAFGITKFQTEMGEEEEQEAAKAKLKKIVIQAKKFKAGEDNATVRKLTIMLKNNKKYKRDRALKAYCIKVEDYERVKEELGITDADIDLYSTEVNANGKTYELKSLFPNNCFY